MMRARSGSEASCVPRSSNLVHMRACHSTLWCLSAPWPILSVDPQKKQTSDYMRVTWHWQGQRSRVTVTPGICPLSRALLWSRQRRHLYCRPTMGKDSPASIRSSNKAEQAEGTCSGEHTRQEGSQHRSRASTKQHGCLKVSPDVAAGHHVVRSCQDSTLTLEGVDYEESQASDSSARRSASMLHHWQEGMASNDTPGCPDFLSDP